MKKIVTLLAAFTLAGSLSALGQAGGPVVVSIDENGNGLLNGAPLPGHVLPDALSPTGSALTYQLPFALSPGFLAMIEPNGPTAGQVSDLIRFDANGLITFYSDVSAADPADALADVGIPVEPGAFALLENGVEGGNQGLFYGAGPGDPGFDYLSPFGVPVSYNIISDTAVPEPTTMLAGALLLLPFAASLLRFFRRRQTA